MLTDSQSSSGEPGKRGKRRNSGLNSVLPHHLTAILPYTNSSPKLHCSGFRCCLLVFIVLCYKTRSVCDTHQHSKPKPILVCHHPQSRMKVCLQKASGESHSKSSQYFVYAILCLQHHQNQPVHTLECLKTTSTVLLENNGENWKRQVLPSSVLSGRIKLWFKHQLHWTVSGTWFLPQHT